MVQRFISAPGAVATGIVAWLGFGALTQPGMAQQATIGGYGCGTGCSISIEQLSSPTRMGNGWSKVLVKETAKIFDMNGRLERKSASTFWQFAKCDGDLLGRGYKSDGSDASTDRIYNEDGNKILDNAGGQAYGKWEALCTSPH
jgi:hypothetical protein